MSFAPTPPPPQYPPARSFGSKPPKVQAIAIMTTAGGGVAILFVLIDILFALICCITIVAVPYGIVVAVFALMKGIKLLNDHNQTETAPYNVAIMQIINIISLDVVNLVLGIITLVFLSDPEVKKYYRP
jgi:uncharacterized membrane protein YbjE (DUF340 family)